MSRYATHNRPTSLADRPVNRRSANRRRESSTAGGRQRQLRRLELEQLETRSLLSADLVGYGCAVDRGSFESMHAARHAGPPPARQMDSGVFRPGPRGMGHGEGEAPPPMQRSARNDPARIPQSNPQMRPDHAPIAGSRPDGPVSGRSNRGPEGIREPVNNASANQQSSVIEVSLTPSVPGTQQFLGERTSSSAAATDVVLSIEFSAPRSATTIVFERGDMATNQPSPSSQQPNVSQLLGSSSRQGPSLVRAEVASRATIGSLDRGAVPSPDRGASNSSVSTQPPPGSTEFQSQRVQTESHFFAPQGSKLRLQQASSAQLLDARDSMHGVVEDLGQQRELGENVQQLNELLDLLTEAHARSALSHDTGTSERLDGTRSAGPHGERVSKIENLEALPFGGMIAVALPESELIRELGAAQAAGDQSAAWTSRIGILRSGEWAPADRDVGRGLYGVAPFRSSVQEASELSSIRLRPVLASATAVLGGVFMAARRLQAKAKKEQERLEQL